MVPESEEAILRKTQLFAKLTESEMRILCERVSGMHFGRGETLFSEGDPCHGLFVVATGRIRIFKLSSSGPEQVLAVEGPGSSFAELPVFDGGVYPASACTLEDAEVLFISRKDFQSYCCEHPDVALKVLAVVGSRLRRLVGIIEDLSSGNNPPRVGGGIGNRTGTRVQKSESSPSRRTSGGRWPYDHRKRSRRAQARADRIGITQITRLVLKPGPE
jgi:CRP-like cAMP-binding protein